MDICAKIEDFGDFKIIRNVISDNEIQSVINFWNSFNSFIDIDINVWDTTSTSITRINASNRFVDIVGIQKNDLPFLSDIFSKCFGCILTDFNLEFPHYFTHYPIGGKHSKHRDFIPSFNIKWIMILMLNDDFEGGELIVNEKVVPKEKGMAILFDGSIFHEVTPVLFGERFVVAECAGKN
jgi:hypothetical protein